MSASSSAPKERPLWAIVGPTASGKSNLALGFAEHIGAEIIGADAVQVYRGCDIGSAKATPQERARVRHHVIDCADPHTPFDASLFVAAAEQALCDVAARGRMPLICGGTGLYVRALRLGLIDVPKDAKLRSQLEADDLARPGTSLERLRTLDPASARTIDANNGHYLRRALEITLLCGTQASALRRAHAERPPRHPMVLWWIDRSDDDLRQRIAARSEAMVAAGLVAEVQHLMATVPQGAPVFGAVGYKEARAVVRGELAAQKLVPSIAASTWQYARRQRIWLRREMQQAPSLVRRLMLPREGIEELMEAWHKDGRQL